MFDIGRKRQCCQAKSNASRLEPSRLQESRATLCSQHRAIVSKLLPADRLSPGDGAGRFLRDLERACRRCMRTILTSNVLAREQSAV